MFFKYVYKEFAPTTSISDCRCKSKDKKTPNEESPHWVGVCREFVGSFTPFRMSWESFGLVWD